MTSRSKRRSGPKHLSSREKVRAHRKRLRARGLRPIQIWVPDTRTAAFKVEAHRQSEIVAQGPYARRDQDFIDAISLQPGD
jgi:antidote-toxin recognition MazE-like antitoxin